MGTVSKEIADAVIAREYDDDNPLAIWKYTNAWGDDAYGLICEGQRSDTYRPSEWVINPTLYWSKE